MKRALTIILFLAGIFGLYAADGEKESKNWAYLSVGVSPLYFQSFTFTGKYWYDKYQVTDFGLIANAALLRGWTITPSMNPNYGKPGGAESLQATRFGFGLGPYWAWRIRGFVLTSAVLYEYYAPNFEFNGKALFEVEYDVYPEIMLGVAASHVFQGGPKNKMDQTNPYYYPYSDFNIELKIAMTFEKTRWGQELAHKSIFGIPLAATAFVLLLFVSAGGAH